MNTLTKFRLFCVALSVVSLVVMGIELFVNDLAHYALFYICGVVCIFGLVGNAIGAFFALRQRK